MSDQEKDVQKATIETELTFPKGWRPENEERYIYAFHNSESPNLEKNQLSLYGIELKANEDGSMTATALVRSTIPKDVYMEKTPIILMNEEQQPVAKRTFDLLPLGTLSENTATPWKFTFRKEDFLTEETPVLESWSLAFETRKKNELDLDESWEKSVADKTKSQLKEIIEKAPPLKPGEVNIIGLQVKKNKEHQLVATILIRNGSNKDMNLEQLPLEVKDANDQIIARGGFTLKDFVVKANTSKPWTFVFPADSVKKGPLDLTKWKIYPIE